MRAKPGLIERDHLDAVLKLGIVSGLLRHSVAEFERHVKRNIGLWGNSSQATLGNWRRRPTG
jgi:hypothetical protein